MLKDNLNREESVAVGVDVPDKVLDVLNLMKEAEGSHWRLCCCWIEKRRYKTPATQKPEAQTWNSEATIQPKQIITNHEIIKQDYFFF